MKAPSSRAAESGKAASTAHHLHPAHPAFHAHRTEALRIDPRQSMAHLPTWMQPWLTELTGKALPGEVPPWRWTTTGRLMACVGVFLLSVLGSMVAVHQGGPPLLLVPLFWMFTVGAARSFQISLVHHASHGRLLRNPEWNDRVADLLSLLAWIAPVAVYRKAHRLHHGRLGTHLDPDLRFIVQLGLVPGLDVATYWHRFFWTLVSPTFHARYLAARWKANFVSAPPLRRAASIGFALLLGLLMPLIGWELLIGYVLPVTIFVQMSAWAGLLGLHHWTPDPKATSHRAATESLTHDRFIGEPFPAPGMGRIQDQLRTVGWFLRMGTIHLAQRVLVVQADNPSHRWHHEVPVSWEWPMHAYARRDHVAKESGTALDREIWGAGNAIRRTFEHLAAIPSDRRLDDPPTSTEVQGTLTSM
jgi:hypothetical protein